MNGEKWKMESGKWKVENGKWKVENGKGIIFLKIFHFPFSIFRFLLFSLEIYRLK